MSVVEKTRVFRTSDMVEVRALADHLNKQGVSVHLAGGSTVCGPYGVMGVDLTANLELWTDDQDAERARLLIAEWNRAHHPGQEQPQPLRYSVKTLLMLTAVVALAAAAVAVNGEQPASYVLAIFFAIVQVGAVAYFACALRRRRVGNWEAGESREDRRDAPPQPVEKTDS